MVEIQICFFDILVFFTYFLERKKIEKKKKLIKVFLYAIFEFENFNLVFETVCILLFF